MFYKGESGFTLIEMVVVLVILAMAAAIVIPRLPDTRGAALGSSARNLATFIRYSEDQVTLSRQPLRIRLSPGTGNISVFTVSQSGTELPPKDPFFSRPVLADGITFSDIQLPRLGTVNSGELMLDIGPAGLSDFVTFHIKNENGIEMTVMAFPVGGRVKVEEGRKEISL
jgi:general secretion pathway protein H